ncbi:mitochondrial carrier domain-containing protein [Chytridium lagenaria]|nr:mitochondrial carrier domain-containing protein [Chytridium lagenaria]
MATTNRTPPLFHEALIAGAVAGTSVDTVFFPLDTIKTRLQSKEGFRAAGGFNGLFSGLSSAVLGSAPGAAAFFVTYEFFKSHIGNSLSKEKREKNAPFIHMAAASAGEVAACFIRVPTEVVKQRMQAGQFKNLSVAVSSIVRQDGLSGLYRGYFMTIFREIPFTCVQFPLYEHLKKSWREKYGTEPKAWVTALFGSLSGGIAAAVTTPLDVIKTRLMLSRKDGVEGYSGIVSTFRRIVKEEGTSALFRGIGPRVTWISLGGAVFLGTYEFTLGVIRSQK